MVWEVLPKLKSYLAHATQSGSLKDLPLSTPLQNTLVLYQGRLLRDGIEIIPGDATKGKLAVLLEDNVLEGATVLYAGSIFFDRNIVLGSGVVVEPGALIKGPTVIGDQSEVRQGAYMRGSCLVGKRCVVGHVTEMKSTIMLDDAKAGHFAYLGDSILGRGCNLGAGTKLANLKFSDMTITINVEGTPYHTNLRKLGAIAGDGVQTGCNSVTNPGTILGKHSFVYPNTTVSSGYHGPRSIIRK